MLPISLPASVSFHVCCAHASIYCGKNTVATSLQLPCELCLHMLCRQDLVSLQTCWRCCEQCICSYGLTSGICAGGPSGSHGRGRKAWELALEIILPIVTALLAAAILIYLFRHRVW